MRADEWSGHISNEGVWWLGAIVLIILLIVFIGTPLIERWINRKDTGHEED